MSSVLELLRERLPVWVKSELKTRRSATWRESGQSPSRNLLRIHVPVVEDLRVREIRQTCELLAEGFENLDSLLNAYLRDSQELVFSSSEEDIENFLQWLTQQNGITDEQKDVIICQRARFSVEYAVLARKLAHARFQAMLTHTDRSFKTRKFNKHAPLHLNPVRVLATLETHALVDEAESLPVKVLFYPVGEEVRSLVIDGPAMQIVQRLSSGPLSRQRISQWVDLNWNDLIEITTHLIALGVVADACS